MYMPPYETSSGKFQETYIWIWTNLQQVVIHFCYLVFDVTKLSAPEDWQWLCEKKKSLKTQKHDITLDIYPHEKITRLFVNTEKMKVIGHGQHSITPPFFIAGSCMKIFCVFFFPSFLVQIYIPDNKHCNNTLRLWIFI